MFMIISCSSESFIINFCTAAPAIINAAFFRFPITFFSAANNVSSSLELKSGIDKISLPTAAAGPMRLSWPFMARFSSISTTSKRLISLVPSKMRLIRLSRYARSIGASAEKPIPPYTCTPSSTTKSSTSEPCTFMIAHSIANSSRAFNFASSSFIPFSLKAWIKSSIFCPTR
ncbi:hypothetical protein D3C86_1626480 [compost metagenome]